LPETASTASGTHLKLVKSPSHPAAARPPSPRQGEETTSSIILHLQGLDKRRLGDVHLAELAHALLALFLLVEQLALAGDVAAVAFGGDVLAQGGNRLASENDLRELVAVRRP
jgi:hypothetical protein